MDLPMRTQAPPEPGSQDSLTNTVLSNINSRLRDAGKQTTDTPRASQQHPLHYSTVGAMTQKLIRSSLPPSWNCVISFPPWPHLPAKPLSRRAVRPSPRRRCSKGQLSARAFSSHRHNSLACMHFINNFTSAFKKMMLAILPCKASLKHQL